MNIVEQETITSPFNLMNNQLVSVTSVSTSASDFQDYACGPKCLKRPV